MRTQVKGGCLAHPAEIRGFSYTQVDRKQGQRMYKKQGKGLIAFMHHVSTQRGGERILHRDVPLLPTCYAARIEEHEPDLHGRCGTLGPDTWRIPLSDSPVLSRLRSTTRPAWPTWS